MIVNVKSKLNPINQIIKAHGLDENGPIQAKLLSDFDRFSDPYIPMDRGQLKNNKTYPNKHSIKYESPYAHYMYMGKVAVGPSRPKGVKRTISNKPLKYQGAPKRGAKWDKRMWNDRKNDILRDLQILIKGG